MYSIDRSVLDEIEKSLIRPETGGILGVDSRRIVTRFYHDWSGTTTTTHYIPDVRRLNQVIEQWATEGIEFVGFVHAHPKHDRRLSPSDLKYARKIKACCSLSEILMLLYIPDEEKQSDAQFIQYVI